VLYNFLHDRKDIPQRWWKFGLMLPPSRAPAIPKQIVEFATFETSTGLRCLVGAPMASRSTFSKDREILALPEGSQSRAAFGLRFSSAQRCAQCGKTPNEDAIKLEVDHKLPLPGAGTAT
jgi:hypothetical protein